MSLKKKYSVLLVNALLAIVVINQGNAAENTFEIDIHKKPGQIDTNTAIKFIDEHEQVYLSEILRLSSEHAQHNDREGKDFGRSKPIREKRLDLLLKLEDVKGQILGPLYSGQMQGIRKLLYVLILTDDGIWEHTPFGEMRYQMVLLTSDNVLKLSTIRAGVNERIYISDDTKYMLKDIVSEINAIDYKKSKRQL